MKKNKKPLTDWTYDASFFSYEIVVSARTRSEARKKAIAKLKRTPVTKFLNKSNSYLDQY